MLCQISAWDLKKLSLKAMCGIHANVVSLIYDMYLASNSLRKISAELFDGGIKSPPGHDNWSAQYIDNILSSKKCIDIVSLERFFAAC